MSEDKKTAAQQKVHNDFLQYAETIREDMIGVMPTLNDAWTHLNKAIADDDLHEMMCAISRVYNTSLRFIDDLESRQKPTTQTNQIKEVWKQRQQLALSMSGQH